MNNFPIYLIFVTTHKQAVCICLAVRRSSDLTTSNACLAEILHAKQPICSRGETTDSHLSRSCFSHNTSSFV